MMNRLIARKTIVIMLILSVINLGFPSFAFAGMIGTQSLVESQQRGATISRIQSALQQERIQNALTDLGVDTNEVQSRVAGLSDSELQQLDGKLQDLPAGSGVLVVIGVVFVVLVVLEVVGVTDVFSAI